MSEIAMNMLFAVGGIMISLILVFLLGAGLDLYTRVKKVETEQKQRDLRRSLQEKEDKK